MMITLQINKKRLKRFILILRHYLAQFSLEKSVLKDWYDLCY